MTNVGKQFGLYTVKEELKTVNGQKCYRATDPFLGLDVCLHLIQLSEKFKEGHLVSLQQRLEALAKLEHPALVPIHDIGREKGACYYTTAFHLKGKMLKSLSPMSEKDGLWHLKRFTEGLAYAHTLGFEHGSIDENDLFLNEHGSPVLANFGISTLLQQYSAEAKAPLTATQLQQQAFSSLGRVFLSLVLDKEQLSLPLEEQIKKINGKAERGLIEALLEFSSDKITGYGELIRKLTALLPKEERKTPVEKIYSHDKDQAAKLDVSTQALVKKLTKVSNADIRELVTEKARLQIRLEKELGGREKAERKQALLEQALSASQRAEEMARLEAKAAWQKVESQEKRKFYPLACLVIGCLAGSMLSFFLLQGTDLSQKNAVEEQQRFSARPVPVTVPVKINRSEPEPAKESSPVLIAQEKTVQEEDVQSELPLPEPEEEQVVIPQARIEQVLPEETVWLPAGAEFLPEGEFPLAFSVDTAPEFSEEEKTNILGVIQGWVWSWQNKNVSAYLSHYSTSFSPGVERSREEWEKTRKERINRPEWIEVELKELQIAATGPERAEVRMNQVYRSDVYGDQTLKSLELVREKGSWKICKEQSLLSPGLLVGG